MPDETVPAMKPWPALLLLPAVTAVLLMPLFLLHARLVGEVVIGLVDVLLLASLRREFLSTTWFRIGLAWWAWLVVCSLPGIGQGGMHSLTQAVLTIRFLLFLAALEWFVLAGGKYRRWLRWVVAASAIYIGIQTLLQFTVGRNLFGNTRMGDGELTGPFNKPRAAAPLSRMLFPAVLPPVARLLSGGGARRLAAIGVTLLSVGVMVLIGQRMPLLLTALGLLVTGLLLPRLRLLLLAAIVAAGALVGASVVVSPPTYHRLVLKFSSQMEDFKDSPYGQILARALTMAEANPWVGRGFDGFRDGCADPRYFVGWDGRGDGGGAGMCQPHPHNHYLQAATDAGIPGLVLFSALVLAWLAPLAQGLWRDPDPVRVGLFVAALIQEWPIASTSSFTSMPLGGWFFLLLGWGLAEARWRPRGRRPISAATTLQATTRQKEVRHG